MAEQVVTSDSEFSSWYPTYGLLAAQRVLERYKLEVPPDELIAGLKDTTSPYYYILRAPMKHLFNGIIIQQAKDYQIYAQKLLIDYLLSGKAEQGEEESGGEFKGHLEEERNILLSTISAFEKHVLTYQNLIAKSQKALIKLTSNWPAFVKTLEGEHEELDKLIDTYLSLADKMTLTLCDYRRHFRDVIVRVSDIFKTNPDYKPDEVQDMFNRSSIMFDCSIGEDT